MFAKLGDFNTPDTGVGQALARHPSNWRYHSFSRNNPAIREMQFQAYMKHAAGQGAVASASPNSAWTVITLWDIDGVMGEPWKAAGYNVISVQSVDDFPTDLRPNSVYAVITCPARLSFSDATEETLAEKIKQAFSLIGKHSPPVWLFLSDYPIEGAPHASIVLRKSNGHRAIQSLTGGFPFSISLPEHDLPCESYAGFSYRFFMEANHIDHPHLLLFKRYPRISHFLLKEASIFFDLDEISKEVDELYSRGFFRESAQAIHAMIERRHVHDME